VKEAILPFNKFPGVDILLGPEMRSTGEVMGIDTSFERAFIKSQDAASNSLPTSGRVFISVRNDDKPKVLKMCRSLLDLGFEIVATRQTQEYLFARELRATLVNKVLEGRPHIVDALINDEICMVVNTTSGQQSIEDSKSIRRVTLQSGVPYFTTIPGAAAAVAAMIDRSIDGSISVTSLQEYHRN
jgi:carbamoyl-phosphate synthase large subunit